MWGMWREIYFLSVEELNRQEISSRLNVTFNGDWEDGSATWPQGLISKCSVMLSHSKHSRRAHCVLKFFLTCM